MRSTLLALGLLLASCGDSEPDDVQQLPQCNYMGTLYDDGEVFPAVDGCNTCKCNPTGQTPGQWGCSTIGCFDAGPADAQVERLR